MIEEQKLITINASELVSRVDEMKKSNHRLVQICCAKIRETIEVNYSFDKDYHFTNFRIVLPLDNLKIDSISSLYLPALLYENEMHDLFGVEVTNIAIDYNGTFYRTTVKTPFNPKKVQE
ncbi:MAG TPA: NADH-quinone oxidoreductase subunit C [Chitinispirillaceae bacterium]|nr:NADH-quinone oxidoreductase subunit C [Chitinispirillaceae bacterium]